MYHRHHKTPRQLQTGFQKFSALKQLARCFDITPQLFCSFMLLLLHKKNLHDNTTLSRFTIQCFTVKTYGIFAKCLLIITPKMALSNPKSADYRQAVLAQTALRDSDCLAGSPKLFEQGRFPQKPWCDNNPKHPNI